MPHRHAGDAASNRQQSRAGIVLRRDVSRQPHYVEVVYEGNGTRYSGEVMIASRRAHDSMHAMGDRC